MEDMDYVDVVYSLLLNLESIITFGGRVVPVPTTKHKSSHYGGCYSLLVGSTFPICIFSGTPKNALIG